MKGNNGDVFDWLLLATGVPRGSVLATLLFTIFILGLPLVLTNSEYMLYADDLRMNKHTSATSNGLATLLQILSRNAKAVLKWFGKNGLPLNSKKMVALLIGSTIVCLNCSA